MTMQLANQPAVDAAAACDQIVQELLSCHGIVCPPVDALALAEQLGLTVIYDAEQRGRARIKRLRGASAIFLQPDDRPERLQWATAHEIGEYLANEIMERLGLTVEGLASEPGQAQREQLANEFAQRLLLPQAWFAADVAAVDADLTELKGIYSTASHELILTSTLRLKELSLVTIFDHGKLTRRRGNGQLAPPRLLPIELQVFQRVHQTGEPCELNDASVRVRGWPVHEPGWKRELLRTTPRDECVTGYD
ncbi:MAG: ImmA/IrrE family metallo-endopeptidase [Planctomycetaceae bacterium]